MSNGSAGWWHLRRREERSRPPVWPTGRDGPDASWRRAPRRGTLFPHCPLLSTLRYLVGGPPPRWLSTLAAAPLLATVPSLTAAASLSAAVSSAGNWEASRDGRPEAGRDRSPSPEENRRPAPPADDPPFVQAILDACSYPAILVGADGLVHHVSAALGGLLGIRGAELVGRTCGALLTAAGGTSLAAACQSASSIEPYSTWVQVKAGTPLAGSAGRPIGVVVTGVPLQDPITGGRRTLLTLQPQDDLESSGGCHDDLLLILSHELRRPLASISASAELLAGGGLDAGAQAALLRTVRAESNALASYLSTILDAERVRSGASDVAREPVALEPLVRSVLAELRALNPGRVLSARLSGELPLACGDRVRIAIVLRNLLENACKYAPGDSPVDIVIEYPGGDEVFVSVVDRGEGLQPEHLGQLFRRFWRADHGRDDAWRGGFGVGLYISRVLVEAQGGRIGVRSTPGEGATFWFSIPVVDGEDDDGQTHTDRGR